MKSIDKTDLSANEIKTNKNKLNKKNLLEITNNNNIKRKNPSIKKDEDNLNENNNQLLFDSNINYKLNYDSSDETENFFNKNLLNRRWLLLMEPINALHIGVILGAKVN